ncbi:DUF6305 family protein [Virgibacillus siamensis]|uniref:DUF6305 family protein n=1 Tax=Virgibacillus siamensis TaxID=480071 RepID=UPI00098677C2|nr:DUF6305 family protein [Virgibacillus siamensis]
MKRYVPISVCFVSALILCFISINDTHSEHFNTYPNLPAPIGKEKILITSTGQAPEGSILLQIAQKLNLEADYRPRALGSDLYDYNSVVILLGYSANGLKQTNRTFQEELIRTRTLLKEAEYTHLPIILVNISGFFRDDRRTIKLFKETAPYADYFIGMKNTKKKAAQIDHLRELQVPVTLVNGLKDLSVPFNAIFR